eukprot:jgi/Picsp_1/5582/NSC_02941-R1_rab3 gtpase-activating protein non-catalytic subunit
MSSALEVPYLAKLLLQYDKSPYIDDLDLVRATSHRIPLLSCLHPSLSMAAVAFGRRLVVVPLTVHTHPVLFATLTGPSDVVTAMSYLKVNTVQNDGGECCLIVGTSKGYVQLHSEDGALVHRQDVHHGALTSVRVRTSREDGVGEWEEEVAFGFSDGVVVVQAVEIRSLFQYAQSSSSRMRSSGDGVLEISKWSFKRQGARSCTAIVGPWGPSLYSMLSGRKEGAQSALVLSVGRDPPVAAYRLDLDGMKKGGVMSFVSSVLTSALVSATKGYNSSNVRKDSNESDDLSYALEEEHHEEDVAETARDEEARQLIKGRPVHRETGIWDDEGRYAYGLDICSSGKWAACCDSLGRILVLDLPSISIFLMLKGYRDAQIAWMTVKSREAPLLLIYAPKRRVVEVWDILQGKRLVSTSKDIPEKGLLIPRTSWEHSVSNTKVMLLDVHRLCFLQLDNTVCSAV